MQRKLKGEGGREGEKRERERYLLPQKVFHFVNVHGVFGPQKGRVSLKTKQNKK